MIVVTQNCRWCDGKLEEAFTYDKPPERETPFAIPPEEYNRVYDKCVECGHYFSHHKINLDQFYEGEYVEKTYGSKMIDTFNKIINLPPEKSDNAQRVQRIKDFKESYFSSKDINLLDVGSGLGVFPYAINKLGWEVTALDPDPNAARYMRENLGLNCIQGDFFKQDDLGQFDIITFNKVLEHVHDPVAMLKKAASYLKPGGVIYNELPDGSEASKEGKEREEFFIEHHHVFSLSSAMLITEMAGFKTLDSKQIHEPSTKYTLYIFCVSKD